MVFLQLVLLPFPRPPFGEGLGVSQLRGSFPPELFKPTFRTLSVTTSQKRKGRESKYLSRGVSWRQAAGN
ncbi:unknown protein [Microcystis aeruginosa NIES-843]|uniref:Uncharacterized protein n=1 Tax=Microcystis aeruginosa (strain NIES-843 / IAM M-2473) TaxID=449447 RepID=B0JG80_MICAN|nr:unknown protein [Microcystis aeruginosa NIES-843]